MKLLVPICLLLPLFLTGCDRSGPLAKSKPPDLIRVYSAGSQTVVTNKEALDHIVSQFTGSQKRWQSYWATLPYSGVAADLERNGENIASIIIGPDWVIVRMASSSSDTYSTAITKEERDDLLRLLGVKKDA